MSPMTDEQQKTEHNADQHELVDERVKGMTELERVLIEAGTADPLNPPQIRPLVMVVGRGNH
jgi:hypothetical protein